MKSQQLLAWGLLLILALVWGSSFILIKFGLKALTPGEVGALRIVAAAVFLLPLAVRNLKGIDRRQWLYLFIIGLCGSLIPSFLFAIAQTQIPSSVTGILNALTPMFTMIIGFIFFNQRLSLNTTIGLLIGFAGSIYLILAGNEGGIAGINYYALLIVLATIFYGTNLNIIKFKLSKLNARTITSISLILVGPIATVYLLGFTDFISHMTVENSYYIGAVVLLGVLGTAIALVLFNEMVKITNPIFASSVTYLIPIVAVVWGLLDGERLFVPHYIGMALIILGVYLANKKRTARRQSVNG
jgi:drug/metabolite transporter (DMT)-like permease